MIVHDGAAALAGIETSRYVRRQRLALVQIQPKPQQQTFMRGITSIFERRS
jgi:hypothetical protein